MFPAIRTGKTIAAEPLGPFGILPKGPLGCGGAAM